MWKHETMVVKGAKVEYWIKHFEEGSEFGIKGGRISKLTIKVDGKETVNYDRGWDIRPKDEISKEAYDLVLKKYN